MKRILMAALVCAGAPALTLAGTATGAHAAEVAISSEGPVVEMQVSQSVLGDPDKAMVSAGVTTRAQTAVAAMQANATQMDQVLKRLDALGIPRDRVQTSGITLNAQYDYGNNRLPRFVGYDATNRVTVELRNLDRVGNTLDALVASGANNLNGPQWGLVDPEPSRAKARALAFAKAGAQARDYAKMAGYSDVRLLSVAESVSFRGGMDEIIVTAQSRSAPAVTTPVRPGQVSSEVTLTAQYELVR